MVRDHQFGVQPTQLTSSAGIPNFWAENGPPRAIAPCGWMTNRILDISYKIDRHDGRFRDIAVLSVIGVKEDERHTFMGSSVAPSEPFLRPL